MKKVYDPRDIELPLYKHWEKMGYFKPHGDQSKESFCIVIPPPNVTGNLHIGHAFQYSIIDIMIRYQRMQGKNTLWQMGTDHAGIATQIVVEQKIAATERKTRHDYNRDRFIEKIWQWKTELGETIIHQMRRLGYSVDWERERFTMDEGLSNAVKKVFIHLYKENLVYRKKYLVNWDPKLNTAISDLEVEHREFQGLMWYIRYPLADGAKTIDNKDYLVVATTRPETLFGDVSIAVNPMDQRYNNLIGKFIILPFINRRIPILGDKCVDMKKGTGCVKITPAHDFNDYEVGRRHSLPMINIFTFDGHIREKAEVYDDLGNISDVYENVIPIEFQKMERFSARKAIISSLNAINLLEESKLHTLTMPYSSRSGVIIEPILTDQWYLRTSILAKPAVEAVKNGNIRFIPKHYEKIYFSWMRGNIQDWCISRQLWWGHRIPAWYDQKGKIYVGYNEEKIRQEHNLGTDIILHQDEDVLDTWFSSSLWIFSSLGWPESTSDLYQFYPTNVIVSGFDIIFFWIARMIMMSMHFIKDKNGKSKIPFYTAYITGLINDEEGQKMSKSKGNVIDPLDIVDGITLEELLEKRTRNMIQPQIAEKIKKQTKKRFPHGIKAYGADALRFTLASIASTGREIPWDMKRLEGYRNFCNKLWNAGRFVIMNLEGQDCGFNDNEKALSLSDRWILAEFSQTVKKYRKALDSFRFDIATNILYTFTWNQFCDWYLEFTKLVIGRGSDAELRGTRHTLISVLEGLLRLAHPIIPFITETIWKRLNVIIGINIDTIMMQPFPKPKTSQMDKTVIDDVIWLKKVITAVRNTRTEMRIPPNKSIDLLLYDCNEEVLRRIDQHGTFLQGMAHLASISILPTQFVRNKYPISITKIIDGAQLLIPIEDLIDKKTRIAHISKEIEKVNVEIEKIQSLLINKNFTAHALKEVIAKKRKRLSILIDIKSKLDKQRISISD